MDNKQDGVMVMAEDLQPGERIAYDIFGRSMTIETVTVNRTKDGVTIAGPRELDGTIIYYNVPRSTHFYMER